MDQTMIKITYAYSAMIGFVCGGIIGFWAIVYAGFTPIGY